MTTEVVGPVAGRKLGSRIMWSRAKRLAAAKGISVAEARNLLKENPEALANIEYSQEVLDAKESELRKEYPYIVKGSIRFHVSGVHKNKMTVEIACQWPGCTETREVATSDLHQVKYCETHTREARLARRREKWAQANPKKDKPVVVKASKKKAKKAKDEVSA